jgi:hypothetical protein
MRQTGETRQQRQAFLNDWYNKASVPGSWEPISVREPLY